MERVRKAILIILEHILLSTIQSNFGKRVGKKFLYWNDLINETNFRRPLGRVFQLSRVDCCTYLSVFNTVLIAWVIFLEFFMVSFGRLSPIPCLTAFNPFPSWSAKRGRPKIGTPAWTASRKLLYPQWVMNNFVFGWSKNETSCVPPKTTSQDYDVYIKPKPGTRRVFF